MKGFSVPPFAQCVHLVHCMLAAAQNLLLINFGGGEGAAVRLYASRAFQATSNLRSFYFFLHLSTFRVGRGWEKVGAKTPLQKVIMRKRMGMDGAGLSFWKCSPLF